MAYATITDVQARLPEGQSVDAQLCNSLLNDIAVLIDAYNEDAETSAKKIVSCRAVIRAVKSNMDAMPIGATQGTYSALGYSQTFTISNGSVGQLYLDKTDKKYLGYGSRIGASNPLGALSND